MIELTGGVLFAEIDGYHLRLIKKGRGLTMTHEEERVWLIEKLKAENPGYRKIPVPKHEDAQKDMLRMLMNVRMPAPLSAEFIRVQDAYLRKENMLKGSHIQKIHHGKCNLKTVFHIKKQMTN